jgi:zinc transporter ZupT
MEETSFIHLYFLTIPAQAFWFGILSALSLPLGAIIGIYWSPPKRVIATAMAFGAGSLLCALTMELVLPAFERNGFFPIASGAITGGVLFLILNKLLNNQGAFLRKSATAKKHLRGFKHQRMQDMAEMLSKIDIFRAMPPDEAKSLLQEMYYREYGQGTTIFSKGDNADSLYLIESGEVEVELDGKVIACLKDGDTLGEISLITGKPRHATVRTLSEVKAWQILKEDFDNLLVQSPDLFSQLKQLGKKRLKHHGARADWVENVKQYADTLQMPISQKDLNIVAKRENRSGKVAFAIWLGILLDGIPESAVIGASIVHSKISIALVAGLFLANFPESLSSAVSMKSQGSGKGRIFWMWTSLMLITGIGALAGNFILSDANPVIFSYFEGCAAGAMLVMVAETMLPEAYEQGGTIVGMATLIGFLSGLFIKSIS